MEIQIKSFKELSTEELYTLLQLRSEVFVVEQNCVYQDMDGLDQIAFHVLGKYNGALIAYTRLFKAKDYFDDPSIGRVIVSRKHRGLGLGKEIMQASLVFLNENWNAQKIVLSAQSYLKKFYSELGFTAIGEEYLEDGIPHIKMIKTPVS
jgi:ElaA protein